MENALRSHLFKRLCDRKGKLEMQWLGCGLGVVGKQWKEEGDKDGGPRI